MSRKSIGVLIFLYSSLIYANPTQDLLNQHFEKYKNLEYFSGASLSVSIPNQPIENYYAGYVSHDNKSPKVSANTLFQIGSITKSFTAAVMLQLESENKLKLSDPLQQWLPEYSNWSGLDLEQLLNMSSGLPNYSDAPLLITDDYKHPEHVWTNAELVSYVYPNAKPSPPLKAGYFYSNTGYILADMIVEKITHQPFATELTNRTIKAANLKNTFYPLPTLDPKVKSRMAHGYNFNQYDNPPLAGSDTYNRNLSWAAAAGAIVATGEDVIHWIQALFMQDSVLNSEQKQKLMTLISTTTGKPIQSTSDVDPRGFGLGVVQAYDKDKSLGRFWFYEGETLGFRALYMYVPCNNVIIVSLFNSATTNENDHAHELMQNTYKLVLKQHPMLSCQNENINLTL